MQRWRPRVVVTSPCRRQGRTSGEKRQKRAAALKQRDRREPPGRARPLHEVRTTREEAINNHRSAGGAALTRTCVPARVELQTTRVEEEEEDAKLLGPKKTAQPELCTQTKEGGKTDMCLISGRRGRPSKEHSARLQPETYDGAARITTKPRSGQSTPPRTPLSLAPTL